MSYKASRQAIAAATLALALVNTLRAEPPADAKKPAAPPAGSLDDELLKGLGGDPLDDVPKSKPAAPPTKPPDAKPAIKKPAENPLDDELLRDLGDDSAPRRSPAGEDVGDDEISRLTRRMREVERLIRSRQTDEATQAEQKKILAEIETLIEQCSRQSSSSGGASKPQPGQTAQRGKVRQPGAPQPGQGRSANQPGSAPARDSVEGVRKDEKLPPDLGQLSEQVKAVWGELPPRVRQQMLESATELALPKYELLIERYFKSLAEEK